MTSPSAGRTANQDMALRMGADTLADLPAQLTWG
jgi:hypothetical protein